MVNEDVPLPAVISEEELKAAEAQKQEEVAKRKEVTEALAGCAIDVDLDEASQNTFALPKGQP